MCKFPELSSRDVLYVDGSDACYISRSLSNVPTSSIPLLAQLSTSDIIIVSTAIGDRVVAASVCHLLLNFLRDLMELVKALSDCA